MDQVSSRWSVSAGPPCGCGRGRCPVDRVAAVVLLDPAVGETKAAGRAEASAALAVSLAEVAHVAGRNRRGVRLEVDLQAVVAARGLDDVHVVDLGVRHADGIYRQPTIVDHGPDRGGAVAPVVAGTVFPWGSS